MVWSKAAGLRGLERGAAGEQADAEAGSRALVTDAARPDDAGAAATRAAFTDAATIPAPPQLAHRSITAVQSE